MLKVYVAGPLSRWGEHAAVAACLKLNVDKALALGAELLERGYNPYVPHYNHYMHQFCHMPVDYETWMKIDFEWLACCDVLFRMPGASPGGDREVKEAERLGIPVVYSLKELEAVRIERRVKGEGSLADWQTRIACNAQVLLDTKRVEAKAEAAAEAAAEQARVLTWEEQREALEALRARKRSRDNVTDALAYDLLEHLGCVGERGLVVVIGPDGDVCVKGQ